MVQANIETYDSSPWAKVLEQFVDDKGFVDYTSLNNNREDLDNYIRILQHIGPNSRPDLFPSDKDKLAYYINAYNALVFDGVLKRGPESKSVWTGLISGLNFFVRMKVRLDGETTNLRKLENKIIRDKFKDPRIHAALVCASVSCPRLIKQPYSSQTLDQQLDMAISEFVSLQSNVKVDEENQIVYLSEIFDWFKSDFINFEKSNGLSKPVLIDYINRYRTTKEKINREYSVGFIEYNKEVNQQ